MSDNRKPELTAADLYQLDRDELFDYFTKRARYDPDSPTSPYSIRVGQQSMCLFSNDTDDLWRRFYRQIKGRELNGEGE